MIIEGLDISSLLKAKEKLDYAIENALNLIWKKRVLFNALNTIMSYLGNL